MTEDHATTYADQEATGTPADGLADQGDLEPLGAPGLHHWRQAKIIEPRLDERGGILFAAIEMTRMPMILADPRKEDCPIVFANNAFLDLTGYEEAEVLNRNCRFFQGAATDPAAVSQLRDALREHRPIALEILNYRRDGAPFWNAIFMGPVFDQTGELIYFFASQLDVSKRRESEQSLRQAQKMEAIGQLTAVLAHDFNNLLQIVGGSLDRLKAKRHDLFATTSSDCASGTRGFSFTVDTTSGSVTAIAYQMGYMGMQIPGAFQMLRAGVLGGDAADVKKGEAQLGFWANNAVQPGNVPILPDNIYNVSCGMPGWYNSGCHPIFFRSLIDCMLDGLVFMREHGKPRRIRKKFVQSFGDWLVANQNGDGSFDRVYTPDGSVFQAVPHVQATVPGTTGYPCPTRSCSWLASTRR